MLDYDAWKTTPPLTYLEQLMKAMGIKEGTSEYREFMKAEFAEAIAIEFQSGTPDQWAIDYVIEKFFGDINGLKESVKAEVDDEDEAFKEFLW